MDTGARSRPVAIRVENVSKSYAIWSSPAARLHGPVLGQVGQVPFLPAKVRDFCRRVSHESFRSFHALQDISFEVYKGESVGIVGRNGAGKSTLLQIIVRTLQPTTGTVEVNGRVAALLELGSGFNPEFTGRENIYLNASILGLSRDEINEKFDDIAAFADIGDFIDQPVKTYSSGMLVRVAFAVQVQISPDILVVDEALAVGDALFQKRCFQQMEKLIAGGTTIVFVSHDQEAVRTLTSRAILLKDGRMKAYGNSAEVILDYRRLLHEEEKAYFQHVTEHMKTKAATAPAAPASTATSDRLSFGDRDGEVLEVKVLDADDKETSLFHPLDVLRILVVCKVHKAMDHLNVGVRIRNKEGIKIYSWGTLNQDMAIWAGLTTGDIFWDRHFEAGEEIRVVLEAVCALAPNLYEIQAHISEENDRYYGAQRVLHWRDEAAFFQVNMKYREYFFGGICDLRMRAITNVHEPARV
jgi:lipopolysaccharide transport system ATP-binding protein